MPAPARPTGTKHPDNPSTAPQTPHSYFRTRHFRFRREDKLHPPQPCGSGQAGGGYCSAPGPWSGWVLFRGGGGDGDGDGDGDGGGGGGGG